MQVTASKNEEKTSVFFQISSWECPKNGPRMGGRIQFNVFFLTWMHFGRQGLPMELPSDFQEHFYTILTRFGHIVGTLFAKKRREVKKESNKVNDRETSFKSNEYVGTPNTH